MLHLLRRANLQIPRRYIFFSYLLACSAVVHALLLLFIFFVYHQTIQIARISLHDHRLTDAPVIFLPLMKRMPASAPRGVRSSAKTSVRIETQKGGIALMPPQKKASPHQRAPEKAQRLSKKKKNEPEPSVPAEPSARVEPIAKTEPQVHSMPVEQQQPEENSANHPPEVPAGSDVVAAGVIEPIYIGREEKEMLEVQQAIADDIKQVWKAPVGFIWEKPCKVRVSIDMKGSAREVVIEEPTGIPVVDISIANALESALFNSLVRGKEIILFFEA